MNLDKIENYLLNKSNILKINSNEILTGDVFLALQGNNHHGNLYINESIKNGASWIITDKLPSESIDDKKIILVEDVMFFLLALANKKRNIFNGKVIGITGSIGKTTLKEYLKHFLSAEFKISASIKSYNNYLGVLISIINIDIKNDFAIFELGTNNFNEISILTSILLPQQIIITNINPTHLENFKNTRNIAIEKSDIFNPKFNPNSELLIIPNSNIDEIYLNKIAKKFNIKNIFTFGKKNNSDYFIKNISEGKDDNLLIDVRFIKKKYIIEVNKSFLNHINNILICFIIFDYNNLPLETFYRMIKHLSKIDGRGLEKNINIYGKNITLIDESYNASPTSMYSCINYYSKLKLKDNQKKFLILGDMNELGELSLEFHQKIIKQILIASFDFVILSGELFKSALNNLNYKNSNINLMMDEGQILNFLKNKIHNNDTIMIKCSNSTKVNKLAKIISNMES